MSGAGAIVLSDFDGTITVRDLTSAIWDRYLPFDWRAELVPPSEAGAITPFELIRRGYAALPCTPEQLRGVVRAETELRAGFDRLVAACHARDWPLAVVSNGLHLYIDDLVPAGVPVFAYDARYHADREERWEIALPAGLTLAPGEDLKTHVLAELGRRHPGATTVYVGDGRLDFEAARRCDRVFAVRGSTLSRLCHRAGVACAEIDTFDEVAAALA